MKNLLLASVAALSLAAAVPAFAQDKVVGVESSSNAEAGAVIGATGGGAGGAALGFFLGGPIGAVIGGFAGATIGAETGIETASIEYVAANPVEPIYIDGAAEIGYVVPAEVTIYPIQGDDRYGYIYANDRVWIVDMETRAFVQSPGYLVPQATADYAMANPVASAEVEGDVVVGYVLPETVELTPVPDSRYSYVYVGERPALVDGTSRTVIWLN
ncbi:MAG: DUF1236 domain-containing protein [Devosia sp.]|jgi:hypothetical protein|uniref:DUF1236 domain-containing protein n=1 Tax=Devosia sp. XGJD_8 TaxID=3391187 RepID=UPI001E1884C4|nr:DUF1236 domain-containing protein [Alphaproteobacteria bacterium]MBU1562303.1 DUF1236 domain-containing protein [Alphaproteobacteria bacterium]MBU2302725.1 DUF1236 domain-containing protein [Alphaproteobacteria bacterium]MBU2369294.1 DUF1236 domain-containing protein [Alphaproteobacteria bacterium]